MSESGGNAGTVEIWQTPPDFHISTAPAAVHSLEAKQQKKEVGRFAAFPSLTCFRIIVY